MIHISKKQDQLILSYFGDDEEDNWLAKDLLNKEEVVLKKTFHLKKEYVVQWPGNEEIQNQKINFLDEGAIELEIGIKTDNYYRLHKGVLTDKFEIYLFQDIEIKTSTFLADSNISIFRTLNTLISEDIYIGGPYPHAIPETVFSTLLKKFPNSIEKKKYTRARISAILREYFEDMKDGEAEYNKYMNKKITILNSGYRLNLKREFKEDDLVKYTTIFQRLQSMLSRENGYTEKQWQEEILQILLLLYPKYIYVFREVPIMDKKVGDRSLDYLLVDSSGYTDIVEIKRPFGKSIVTESKYRNNFVPLRELSGTIMQIEKYIFYLNRWGAKGEEYLTKKYSSKLPPNFNVKITNPSGLIIMGREHNLSLEQKSDFEVVKRKYKNVIDILTYDNLLERIRYMIDQIKKL